MKILNKYLLALASAGMAFAPAMPMMAAENTAGQTITSTPAGETSETTNLRYVVSSHYKWMVSADIDFGSDKGVNSHSTQSNEVSVSENVIAEGQNLEITMKGDGADGAYTISNSGAEVLNYHVQKDGGSSDIAVGGNILTVAAGTNTGKQKLNYTLDTTTKTAEVAGTYTGHSIFTASVK